MDSLCLKGAPRRIFGHKRSEIRGDWSRLHNEEVYDL